MHTTENNKLIAEFMGGIYKSDRFNIDEGYIWLPYHNITKIKDLKYHNSWHWLMSVVEKIEDMGYPNETIGKSSTFYKGDSTTKIWNDGFIGKTKQQAIYKAVIEFIKWYNENKFK